MTIDFPDDPRGREFTLLVERAKYERWLAQQIDTLVNREFTRIVDLITSSKYNDLTQFQKTRALQLYRELERQIGNGYGSITDYTTRQLKDYATLETEIAQAQAASMLDVDSVAYRATLGAFLPKYTLQAIAALHIQGLNLGDWFDAQARTMSLETRRIIQQALIEGKGPLDIARKIMASDKTQGPVLVRRARNEARAISQTATNTVQNSAAIKSYEALPRSLTDSYRYVAIRDSRTSAICRGLDGRVYHYDDPKRKVPPQHVRCRSGVLPLLKDARGNFIEPPSTPHSFASYSDWLKTQNVSTQNDILGPTRADLWRSGRMTLADTVDSDNRVLTLAQLRNRLGIGVGAGR